MATIRQIIPGKNFIEVQFEGPVRKGFPDLPNNLAQVLAACQEHHCDKVLADYTQTDYVLDSDVLSEHLLAKNLAQKPLTTLRWAMIVPQNAQSDNFHFVNAARNRGVQVKAFLDRGEAIAWLLDPP